MKSLSRLAQAEVEERVPTWLSKQPPLPQVQRVAADVFQLICAPLLAVVGFLEQLREFGRRSGFST